MNEIGTGRNLLNAALAALVAVAAAAAEPAYVNGARVDGATPGEWTHDWDAATAAARKDGKPVFVNFTGSDWCPWCKVLERQVFSQAEWGAWASNHVYLVRLDFPNDKSLVPEKYRDRNRELARRYKVSGYPTCHLLDSAALDEPIGRFGASRDATPSNFIEKVSAKMPGAEKTTRPAEPQRPARPFPEAESRPMPPWARAAAEAAACKLPIQKFPTDGLVAGFRFNARDKANDFVRKGRTFMVGGVPPRANDFAPADGLVKDGVLRVSGEYDNASLPHLDVPELRYDRFTVAMAFLPRENRGRMSPLVSFGDGWRWFHVLLRADGTPEVCFRGLAKEDLSFPLPEKFLPGEWNWIVVAFDAAERRLSVMLNCRRIPDFALPADFAFQFDREDRKTHRSVQFANRNNGTVFKGDVGGFLLFDRALVAEEFDALIDAPVVPRKIWKFRPDEESAALYWNGTVSDGVTTLDARLAGGEVSVSFPERFDAPDGVLDLSKAVVGPDGAEVPLVGIGMEGKWDYPFGFGYRHAVEIRLPDTLRWIGAGGIRRFLDLRALKIPASVKKIGHFAFADCPALEKIEFEDRTFKLDDRVFGIPSKGEEVRRPATNLGNE